MNPDDRLERDDGSRSEPRRRRRWPRNLAITVLVFAGLFTAADRIAVGVAENQIASRIQKSQDLASKPSVSINGFPFLTQLVGMKFAKVTLDARGVVRNGVDVTDLRADLRGVKPTDDYKQATIDRLDGTAFFTWADLEHAAALQGLDVTLADAGDGMVKVSGKILGVRTAVSSRLSLEADNKISVKAVKVDTSIPGLSQVSIPHDFDYTVPVGSMPLGMTLHDFRVASDGVRVSATAQGVTITGSGVQ